jgi:ribonuclease HI
VGDFGHFDARYHVHALVSGVAHLRRDEWWSRANQSFGRSEVKKFRERGGAAQYTAGHALTETGDIEFGGRLLETKMKAAQNTTRSQGIGASTHDRGQRRDVPLHRVYIDGAGARPEGMGSGYAYLNETTGRQRVKRIDGLTNNQAEYRGLKYALMNVPKGSRVTIFTDSQIVCFQFNGTYRVRDAALQQLLARVKEIIRERRLLVTIEWVPRERNQAGPLLEQRPC